MRGAVSDEMNIVDPESALSVRRRILVLMRFRVGIEVSGTAPEESRLLVVGRFRLVIWFGCGL